MFISRARYWKHKYQREHENFAKEATLRMMSETDRKLAEEAVMQHAAQMHSARLLSVGQVGAYTAADISDDMLEKILRDVNAQPKTYVIQEET